MIVIVTTTTTTAATTTVITAWGGKLLMCDGVCIRALGGATSDQEVAARKVPAIGTSTTRRIFIFPPQAMFEMMIRLNTTSLAITSHSGAGVPPHVRSIASREAEDVRDHSQSDP